MKNSATPLRHKKLIIILGTIAIIVIAIYIFLPVLLLNYSNKKLHNLKELYGHVESIDLHFFKGSYSINNFHLHLIDTVNNDTIPFFKAKSIEISIDWKVLFKGAVLAKIFVNSPLLIIVNKNAVKEKAKKTADTTSIQKLITSYLPLTINRFEIFDGKVQYTDFNIKPTLNLVIENIDIVVENLSNVENKSSSLPAKLTARATMYEGKWDLQVFFNVLKRYPTFDMKLKLNDVNMVLLNDFLGEYGNFEIESGKLSIFSEFAGKEGNFGGYVKPFVKDFKVKKMKEEKDFKTIAWEMIVGTAMKIFKNDKTDKVATKIQLNGTFKNTNINIWEAITQILTNAFISALNPSIDNSININKLKEEPKKKKNFIEKILG